VKQASSSGVEIQALINELNNDPVQNMNSINKKKANIRENIRTLGLNNKFKNWVAAYNNLQSKRENSTKASGNMFSNFTLTGRLNWKTLHNQIEDVLPSKLAYNKQSRVNFMNLNSAAREMFGSEYSAHFGKKLKSPQTKSEYSNRKNALLKITSRAPSEVSTEMSTSVGKAFRQKGARSPGSSSTYPLPTRFAGRAAERNGVTPPASPRRGTSGPLIRRVTPPPSETGTQSSLASNQRSLKEGSQRGSASSVGTSQISTEEHKATRRKEPATESNSNIGTLPNELTMNNFRNNIFEKVGKEVVKLKIKTKLPTNGVNTYFNNLKSKLKQGVEVNKQGVINQIVNTELISYKLWLKRTEKEMPKQFSSGQIRRNPVKPLQVKPAPNLKQHPRYMINAQIKKYKNRLDTAKDPKTLLNLKSEINKWNPKATDKHYKNNYLARLKTLLPVNANKLRRKRERK